MLHLYRASRSCTSRDAARISIDEQEGDECCRGEGSAGKLLTDNALYNRLDSVVQRLDTLVTALNKGEGTAGRLLQDKQLYDNMNGAVVELRSLLAEIKKDPKKYLNVKVTIF